MDRRRSEKGRNVVSASLQGGTKGYRYRYRCACRQAGPRAGCAHGASAPWKIGKAPNQYSLLPSFSRSRLSPLSVGSPMVYPMDPSSLVKGLCKPLFLGLIMSGDPVSQTELLKTFFRGVRRASNPIHPTFQHWSTFFSPQHPPAAA